MTMLMMSSATVLRVSTASFSTRIRYGESDTTVSQSLSTFIANMQPARKRLTSAWSVGIADRRSASRCGRRDTPAISPWLHAGGTGSCWSSLANHLAATVALPPDGLIFPARPDDLRPERRSENQSGVHGKMIHSTSWPGAFSHAFRRQDCRPSVLRMATRPRYFASRSQCLRSPRSALLASAPALPGLTPEKAA